MNLTRIEVGSEAWDRLAEAIAQRRDVSISEPYDFGKSVKIKIGEGMWSPLLSTTTR